MTTCPICERDKHYLEVEQSFNDPPLPPLVVKWWAFIYDYGHRIMVMAHRSDGKGASQAITVETWNIMTETHRRAWLHDVVWYLTDKLGGEA